MAVLPDVLADDLDVIFCGTAAGRRSAEVGAYYAGRGNKFWPTLHAVGLTPVLYRPADFRRLLEHKLGLTDLAKFAAGADAMLRAADFDAHALQTAILARRPRFLAFTSKRAAQEYLGTRVDYGLHPAKIGSTAIFTLTSPSGMASGHWQAGVHWHELARLVTVDRPA